MRTLPVLWKTFAIVQSIGIVAMLLTGFYPRLEESPLTYIWAVLLMPGLIVGKPIVATTLAVHDAPDAIIAPLATVSIIVVNAVCWFLFFVTVRFVIRKRRGLTMR
jgi:hypothetical protein